METILIVEDKDSMLQMLKETLESEGYKTYIAKDGASGIKKAKEERVDLILTDLKLPQKDGMELLRSVKEDNPSMPVIVMTAFGSIETAVMAMKEGAYDFITKPFDTDHLLMLIKRAFDNQRLMTENMLLKEDFSARFGVPTIIGKSQEIHQVAQKIQKVAAGKTTVILLGESGTGKELFARAIHYLSPRRDHLFVPINCAAIPKELLESELFGHEKGSFTGADSKKIGKFELADKGTIFLDEVGELAMPLQSKLLRALQEGEIERVGGIRPLRVDVRIVAASNKDLFRAVSDGTFREDLFYRLNVFPVEIPPLRERASDIPLLVEFFINKYCHELKTQKKDISGEALDLLLKYRWKGNVRELENTIERAIILCDGKIISTEHISLTSVPEPCTRGLSLDGSLEDVSKEASRMAETERIKRALKETKGNKTRASELLSVSYKTLLTKIKEYNIQGV